MTSNNEDSVLYEILSEFGDELEQAAENASDPEVADATAVLAAIAKGEPPPSEAVQRLRSWL